MPQRIQSKKQLLAAIGAEFPFFKLEDLPNLLNGNSLQRALRLDSRGMQLDLVISQTDQEINHMLEHYGFIEDNYDPQIIVHLANGFDTLPKHYFGLEKVIHISADTKEPDNVPENLKGKVDKFYHFLDRVGEGEKVSADGYNLPFKDKSIDLVIVKGNAPYDFANPELHPSIARVISEGGIFYYLHSQGLPNLSNIAEIRMRDIKQRYEQDEAFKIVPGLCGVRLLTKYEHSTWYSFSYGLQRKG
ncbi:MAG: hypothetical protein IH934_04175 [Nanoarchaeota archaeon]|nr:hypothetical protein [Nanoarchaeota archaeon]